MPHSYSYTRVSHRNSAGSALSPAAQLDMCRGYHDRTIPADVAWWGLEHYPQNGPVFHRPDQAKPLCPVCQDRFPKWRTVAEHCFEDHQLLCDLAVSARQVPLLQRPAGAKLGNIVRHGDHVIFAELDRAFRAVLDHAALLRTWESMGITIHYANLGLDLSTYSGKMLVHIMAAVAQAQSDGISERAKQTHAQLKKQKRKHAPRKHGFKGKKIGQHTYWIPDPAERVILMEIIRLRDEVGMNWQQISDEIESRFRPLCQGKKDSKFFDSTFFKRRWGWQVCQSGYESFKKTLAEEAEEQNS